MKKAELQELVTELEGICDELSSGVGAPYDPLFRLSSCMAKLKGDPWHSMLADSVLDAIKSYVEHPESTDNVVAETQCLISILTEELEKNTFADTLKKGYEEAKEKIGEYIPEGIKDAVDQAKEASKGAVEQAKEASKGAVEQAKEVGKDAVGQAKAAGKKAKKHLKSKLRNWVLSDDEDDEE